MHIAEHSAGSHHAQAVAGKLFWRLLLPLSGSLVMTFWILGGATTSTFAQGAPAAVTSQNVQYPSDQVSIDAYLAKPPQAGRHPAVILVHDDLGLNDTIRETTRLFAAEGFVTLAPNLLSRSPLRQLVAGQTVEDVKAAFSFLQQNSGVDTARISVVGLGWGGWRAFKLAEQLPALYRAVVFYGTTSDDEQLQRIRTPVLGHYAEYDFQTTGNVLATKRRLGNRFTYYIYPATDRGFLGGSSGAIDYTALIRGRRPDETERRPAGDTVAATVAQTAALQAWERTLAFLRSTN